MIQTSPEPCTAQRPPSAEVVAQLHGGVTYPFLDEDEGRSGG